MEAGVRIVYGRRFAQRPVFYQGDPKLGWRPSPNLDHEFQGGDFAMHIRTDSEHLRLGARGPVPEDARRVVLVGDSYTFGWGVSTDETFASHLDEMLDERRASNLGVGGYGTFQAAERLRRFSKRHGDRVDAVVMLHAHNDATDNVSYALVQSGVFEPALDDRVTITASTLHFVNLIRFLIHTRYQKKWVRPLEDGNDVLFAVRMMKTKTPVEKIRLDGFEVDADQIDMDVEGLKPTLERERFTPIQRRLYTVALEKLHCAAPEQAPVVHLTLHTMPKWYAEEVKALVASAERCGRTVHWRGRIEPQIEGPYGNDHSGGHFNPRANEEYARRILAHLQEVAIDTD